MIDLIERSANLVVNKFACTIVIDVNTGMDSALARNDGNYFRARRWPIFYNGTTAFLHGVYQPQGEPPLCGTLNPVLEGQYTPWRELVHYTIGRNSYVFTGGGEPVCNDYVKYYAPHPAGLFLSHESYNGIGLRNPDWPFASDHASGGWTHGSILQWIGAGGGFTIGGVNGRGSPGGIYAVANLYDFGLSWAEAAWSESIWYYESACPIGDPLARVTVFDPDVTGDGVIDSADVSFVISHWGESGPDGDINHDGIVNEDDLDFIYEAWGRDANGLPPLPPQITPWPPVPTPTANRCGDLNGDGVVDQNDLDMFDARIAACGYGVYSGMFDVNHDVALSPADRAIIAGNIQDPPRCLVDANQDGCVDADDYLLLQQFLLQWGELCDPTSQNWNPLFDVNCDGCINESDYDLIRSHVKHQWQCPNCPDP